MRDIFTGLFTVVLSIFILSWSLAYGGESQNKADFNESESAIVGSQTKNDLNPSIDTDGDGIIDRIEIENGTDPNNGNSKPIGICYEYDAFGRLLEIRRFTTP